MKKYEGTLQGHGLRIGIVASRFNSLVTDRLLDGALAALRQHGVADDDVEVVRVPGSFEIPLFARLLAADKSVHAVVCLGAIIRGETPHHEHLAGAVFASLSAIMERHDVPVALGILTTDTVEQALERADALRGNKGHEVAVTALEMASLRLALAGQTR